MGWGILKTKPRRASVGGEFVIWTHARRLVVFHPGVLLLLSCSRCSTIGVRAWRRQSRNGSLSRSCSDRQISVAGLAIKASLPCESRLNVLRRLGISAQCLMSVGSPKTLEAGIDCIELLDWKTEHSDVSLTTFLPRRFQ